MAISEVYAFTVTVPRETRGYEQQFKIPFEGVIKQILFQASSLQNMDLRFQLRSGGDIIFPSNIQMQPIRAIPVVMDVDLQVAKETYFAFSFDNDNNAAEQVNITLVIYKKGVIL